MVNYSYLQVIENTIPGGRTAVTAFLLGVAWATIVLIYQRIWDGRAGSGSFTALTILDVLFIGGGTGIFLYLTDSYLSSFVYGLGGILFVIVVVTARKHLVR
jgi:hypothetical protein